jgi:predicted NUDIX family phosphoesterase
MASSMSPFVSCLARTLQACLDAGLLSDPALVASFVSTVNSAKQFVPRSVAERDPAFLQPIPCAILRYGDKILFLRRKQVGHPLHGTYAVWAGGHVSQADDGPEIRIRPSSANYPRRSL